MTSSGGPSTAPSQKLLLPLALLLAASAASATAGVSFDSAHAQPRVAGEYPERHRRPCACGNGTLDCSGLQATTLTYADFCEDEVTKVILQRNNFTRIPSGLNASVLEVVASYNRLTRLPLAADLPPGLKTLDVARNHIGGTSDELRPLASLEVLKVRSNALTSLEFLPEECALRVLDAAENEVTTPGAALACADLQVLDLSRNDLDPLPDAAFQNLTELRALDLSANKRITPFTNLTFEGLTQLRNLSLQALELTELSEGLLDAMPELEHIDLRRNRLSALPSNLFTWTPLLRGLNLHTNELSTIPVEAIQNLSILEVLDLSSNRIQEVPGSFFVNFPKLKELSLSGNKITDLPEDAFYGLVELQKLDMSSNRGLVLPSGLLADMLSLEVLRLAQCDLTTVPFDEIRMLTNLSKLDLSGNKMNFFPPKALRTLSRLRHLNLCNTPLGSLPENAFDGLRSLESLRLCDAGISSVPEGLFAGMGKLEWLHLGVNNITSLSRSLFRDNLQLKVLELFRNQLSHVPDGIFSGLRQLRYLFLSNNRLAQLPVLDDCCEALRDATFYSNRIATPSKAALRALLGRGPDGPPHRRVVHLYDNPIAPFALSWLLAETDVELRLSDNCRCGRVRRGQAFLNLCVDTRCGGDSGIRDWVHAVRLSD